jgi:hypothetical protein
MMLGLTLLLCAVLVSEFGTFGEKLIAALDALNSQSTFSTTLFQPPLMSTAASGRKFQYIPA